MPGGWGARPPPAYHPPGQALRRQAIPQRMALAYQVLCDLRRQRLLLEARHPLQLLQLRVHGPEHCPTVNVWRRHLDLTLIWITIWT